MHKKSLCQEMWSYKEKVNSGTHSGSHALRSPGYPLRYGGETDRHMQELIGRLKYLPWQPDEPGERVMKMLAGHQHAVGIHSDDIMKLGVPSAPVAHGCCALPLGSRQPAAGMGHEARGALSGTALHHSSFLISLKYFEFCSSATSA